jgi:hypothetical protein
LWALSGRQRKGQIQYIEHPKRPIDLQILHPKPLAWSLEPLLQYNGRSAVVLASTHGLQLQGCFVRTRMMLPPSGLGAGVLDEGEQEVALFIGTPRLESVSELRVSLDVPYQISICCRITLDVPTTCARMRTPLGG